MVEVPITIACGNYDRTRALPVVRSHELEVSAGAAGILVVAGTVSGTPFWDDSAPAGWRPGTQRSASTTPAIRSTKRLVKGLIDGWKRLHYHWIAATSSRWGRMASTGMEKQERHAEQIVLGPVGLLGARGRQRLVELIG